MNDQRYDRQLRLSEVGKVGQARIESTEARLPAGPASTVALLYLVRAGIGRMRIERRETESFVHASHFRFQGPLCVGAGAHLAHTVLMRALDRENEGISE